MPTLSLVNSLSFHNIEDQEKQFPIIRVFGTIGWIVAGLVISFVLVAFTAEGVKPEVTDVPLYLTALASVVLGLYSFTLPNTPPPAAGEKVSVRSIVGVDAFKQLGSRSFYTFLAGSLLICIPLAAYYTYAPILLEAANFENIAATMTIGQVSEAFFMVLIPFFFIRLGVKWMLAVGMACWVLRYALFALGAPDAVTWMIIAGIALHGICYDFFFVTGQIYVDKKSTPAIRGQAQGLIILTTYGVGLFIGAQLMGLIYNEGFLGDAQVISLDQFATFWWIPAAFAGAVLLFFVAFFNDKVDRTSVEAEEPEATGAALTQERV